MSGPSVRGVCTGYAEVCEKVPRLGSGTEEDQSAAIRLVLCGRGGGEGVVVVVRNVDHIINMEWKRNARLGRKILCRREKATYRKLHEWHVGVCLCFCE